MGTFYSRFKTRVQDEGSRRGFNTRVHREGSVLARAVLWWLAMAKTFREMVVWQLAFEIQEKTNALLKTGPASRDFKFRDQLSDSVRSVPANIAEGFGRYGPAEIMRFVDFARASLDETESHFREAVARSYFPAEEVAPLIRLIARCRTGLARWHSYLRTVKKSPRFHR